MGTPGLQTNKRFGLERRTSVNDLGLPALARDDPDHLSNRIKKLSECIIS